jgi:hypothetical protein
MRQPCRHSGAWDEKSVAGNGTIFVTEGTMVGLYQLVLA